MGTAPQWKTLRGFTVPADYRAPAKHPVESKERLYPFTVRMFNRLMRLQRMRVRVVGAEHVPERGGAIIAANHTGYYDFMLTGTGPLLQGGRLLRYMAKQGVFDIPVLGTLLRTMKHVPVDRDNGGSAVDAAVRGLRDGDLVGIFPEGTISRSFELADFKTGAARIAAQADAPLIPCVIWGSHRIWTKDLPKKFRGVGVIVRYGAPVEVTGDAEADTARLKQAMQRMLEQSRAEYDAEFGPFAPGDKWVPASLGGGAPTLEQAAEMYERERAERKAKKAAKQAKKGT
ncbi:MULTISPECIES: lysophospholipid acyltransferase family protein [Corynebacterium]|uniref:1-acyl-sn-glycerol-3-phosphate acyltransferase n=1 Tax=Corynebacterium hadale TaxID=2026255 RepID=A0A269PB08_9CORY|nr:MULTISPECIES: lysophospholipid acyltransferase family protein [Corynebacterium]PAJ68362.1 1-acyl-sn-glycerol-3-phosphate acyltransferase [Corynebacterium hadale]PAT15805.1 1-acyl-sn-glycerol-3-phosphate acyltransferase [Corynebacterium sp. NML 120412]WKC61168.1 1-acyl-sn-glycerol-3-phosphate acyltransferase [Corynebacterium hadale]